MKVELLVKCAVASVTAAILATACVTSHKKEYITHESWTYSSTGTVTGHEVWSENHHGGGVALLADPAATQIASQHTNQNGLGGSSTFALGNIQARVSSNAPAVITAGGTAVGNAISGAIPK